SINLSVITTNTITPSGNTETRWRNSFDRLSYTIKRCSNIYSIYFIRASSTGNIKIASGIECYDPATLNRY
ncbi:MAG TPA: hypothetical protein PKV79_10375, partial [Candidatus Marinimicrobia bacterium]|nr:hypothetical protein [Candidatus Neomarinimicrobiota bacterium]